MQQVGQALGSSDMVAVASAQMVKHSRRRKNKSALININHFYVLHRVWVLRIMAALAVLLVATTIFQMRETISNGAVALGGMMRGEYAEAGFAITNISIEGRSLTLESEIVGALELDENSSTLAFDAEAARVRLLQLPAITYATVRKVFPGQLIVNVEEIEPLARWRVGGETFIIDGAGKKIAIARGEADMALPLVIGEGAASEVSMMFGALEKHVAISVGLAALSRIAQRRWDLIYENGLRIQLPEFGLVQALEKLDLYQKQYSLLDRDLSLIDMRVADVLVVRIIERDETGTN